MEALNDKGFDFIKGQLEILFKDMAGATGGGLSAEQFAKISQGYTELKDKLDGLVAAGGIAGGSAAGDPTQSVLGATATMSNLNVTAHTSVGMAGPGPAAGMGMATMALGQTM